MVKTQMFEMGRIPHRLGFTEPRVGHEPRHDPSSPHVAGVTGLSKRQCMHSLNVRLLATGRSLRQFTAKFPACTFRSLVSRS
jgi:hypothetical protein